MNIGDLLKLNIEDLLDTDYRFRINRPHSVVTLDAHEIDESVPQDAVSIYAMYGNPKKPPVLVSLESLSNYEIPKIEYSGYTISYYADDHLSITYLGEDCASAILDEEE